MAAPLMPHFVQEINRFRAASPPAPCEKCI